MNEITFYVSTVGNDSWSGRLAEPNENRTDGPWATLKKARDAIRLLKEEAKLGLPVRVWVRGGRYALREPLQFGIKDSWPVTYAAYPGEEPVFDAGQRISGLKEEVVKGIPMWVAEIPDVKKGKAYFRQLHANGRRCERTRVPKQGYYWMEQVPGLNLDGFEVFGNILKGSDTFIARKGDIEAWGNLQDADVVVHHFWTEQRMPIKSFDPQTGRVECTRRSMLVLKDDIMDRYPKYYVENVFEALEEPGEWYLDRTTGRFYYIPLEGETLENTELVFGDINQFLIVKGEAERGSYVEHLRFEGLTFENAGWEQPRGGYQNYIEEDNPELFDRSLDYGGSPQGAVYVQGSVYFEGARYCSVENCTLRHIGWYGIELWQGCSHIRIIGNTIADLGAGGIKLNGSRLDQPENLRNGFNRISDNVISSGGHVFPSAVGIISQQSRDNVFAHNEISHFHYTGISCGYNWGYSDHVSQNNLIEGNYIHHIGMENLLSDMGGIYLLGVQAGTVVRGNIIHDVAKANYGGFGIYTDEGSSHILIENNLTYRTTSQGYHHHYGRENIVRNNIFAFGEEGQLSLSRKEAHIGFTFTNNIVVTNNPYLMAAGYSAELETINCICDNNIYWNYSGEPIQCGTVSYDEGRFVLVKPITFEQWQESGQDRNSKIADPGFINALGGDFTLRKDSPAVKMGFKIFDTTKVGPRAEAERDE